MEMASKYEEYLNGKDSSTAKNIARQTIKVIGAATVIGGGYSGFKALKNSGLLDEAARGAKRFLNTTDFASTIDKLRVGSDIADAYFTGLGKTMKSSGIARTFSGRAGSELRSNLKEEFGKAASGSARGMSINPTRFEKVLLERGQVKKDMAEMAIENARLELMRRKAKLEMANYSGDKDKIDPILENILSQELRNKKLSKSGINPKTAEGHKEITELLKKYNADVKLKGFDYDKLVNVVSNTFNQYKRDDKFVKNYNELIKRKYKALEKQYDESVTGVIGKDSKVAQIIENITGFRRLRVGEAVQSGAFKSPLPYKAYPEEELGKEFNKRIAESGRELFVNDTQRLAGRYLRENPNAAGSVVDPFVYVNKKGDVVDLRFIGRGATRMLDTLAEGVQVPFVNIRPFKMLNDALGASKRVMPGHYQFLRGTVMPSLEENLEEGLSRDYMYFNGRVVNDAGELIKDNQYLVSAKFGSWQRVSNAMSGKSRHEDLYEPAKTFGEFVKRDIFSFGYQEFESGFKRKLSLFTKFFDPAWERNVFENITRQDSSASRYEGNLNFAYKLFSRTVGNATQALDRDTLNLFRPYLSDSISDATLSELMTGTQSKSVMAAIQELVDNSAPMLQDGMLVEKSSLLYSKQLKNILAAYRKDPGSFNKPIRAFKTRKEYVLPEMMEAVTANTSDVLTMMDEAEKILHAELLHQVEAKSGKKIYGLYDDFLSKGASRYQIEQINRLNIHKNLQEFGGPGYIQSTGWNLNKVDAGRFGEFLQNQQDSSEWKDLKNLIYEANPLGGYGPGEKYESVMRGNEYMLIGRSRSPFMGVMEDINKAATLGEKATAATRRMWQNTGEQLGFGGAGRAGRGNMGAMTTASYVSYFYGFRLNEALSKVGLGLSVKDMGSAQDIWLNFALKRGLAPLVAYSGISYINDEIGNLTGEKPSQSLAKGYSNVTVGVQTVKEITGVNALGRHLSQILPGIDRIGETPGVRLLNRATFGIFGETRSPQEMIEYYRHGSDPIRKGRFWSIGSNTPIYGDRIMYYEPNWYRQSMADPMMTDVMYGSTGEYWANHWMPNPRNPLGFLKPGRRRHWINKHWDERPYPVTTSGMEEIPIIGPALDGTLGRLFVPFRRRPGLQRAHEEYIQEINDKIAAAAKRDAQTNYVYSTPGGRMTPSYIMSGGTYPNELQPIEGYADYGAVATEEGALTVVDPTSGFSPMESGKEISRADLTAINTAIISKRYVAPLENRSIQSLRDNVFVQNLEEAVDPNSIGYRLGKTYYSLTEIGGIYGFATTSIFGDYTPQVSLQSTSRMLGFERKFWDRELGGLGGELSEIGRRFLPHRNRQTMEYNPFKNKMPSWLPGPEYFVDFQHGDPYCVSKDTVIEVNELEFVNADKVQSSTVITTHKGNHVPVNYAVKRSIKDNEKVYRLKVASLAGTTQEFSEEHPILVLNTDKQTLYYNNSVRQTKDRVKWKPVKEIAAGDYIAYPIPNWEKFDITIDMSLVLGNKIATENYVYITDSTHDFVISYEWLEKNPNQLFPYGKRKLLLESLGVKNATAFEAAQQSIKKGNNVKRIPRYVNLNEDIAYLFGIYLAEGSLQNSRTVLSHHINEKEYSDRAILGALKIDPSAFCKWSEINGTNGGKTEINSLAVESLLYYLFGKGFDKKTIPNLFAHANEEITRSFLKGLFDGDGSLYYDSNSSPFSQIGKYRLSLKLKNKALLLQVRKLALQYGVVLNVNDDYAIVRGSHAIKFATWLGYEISDNLIEYSNQCRDCSWTIISGGYVYCRVISNEEIEHVKHVYGFEVGIDDSFCTAGIATHNTKIQKGELRLPGAGYEALNKLHPDQLFGEYGALDRFKILADVAPYSEQYKYYSSVVSRMHQEGMISDADYAQVATIREQVSKVKQKYDFHPYKFKYADIDKQTVTVRRWLDANTFLTDEYPGTPIRMAGITLPGSTNESREAQEIRRVVEKYIRPGKRITIGVDSDALNRVKDDTMGTMDAVIYDALGESVNSRLARYSPIMGENPVKADWEDTSATSVNALYSRPSITVGKMWESFAHMGTPFHTKFLQIRSPLEMYKRKELYGKSWQSWGSPIDDFVKPMFESHFSKNPLEATIRGAAFGWLAGSFGLYKKQLMVVGALVSGLGASVRTVGDLAKRTLLGDEDATYIPGRRRREREIEEYFDMLKYVKYKGLYERARRLAINEEGLDPELYVASAKTKVSSGLTRKLETAKKWLKINKSHYYADEEEVQSKLNAINELMGQMAGTSTLAPAGPITIQALRYRQEYLSTLYGADPNGDLSNIYRALPKKDRPFFKEFMLAKPEEREEILRLVPENQKRFYQAKWGMKVDEKRSIAAYFSRYNLPGAGWEGWKPEHSIDEIKIKFLAQKGLELGEFGYWKDDIRHAKDAPKLDKNIKGLGNALDVVSLKKALEGAGIRDSDIIMDIEYLDEEPTSPINIGVNLVFDRRKEIVSAINENIMNFI